jgi:hypothetical protein
MKRLILSVNLGMFVSYLLTVLAFFVPFRVGKILTWHASLVMTVYDEELGAGVYYGTGFALGIPIYSLLIYACLTSMPFIKRLRQKSQKRIS